MKSFPYQTRKPAKDETIMTRIYTCHQDFKPIKNNTRKLKMEKSDDLPS